MITEEDGVDFSDWEEFDPKIELPHMARDESSDHWLVASCMYGPKLTLKDMPFSTNRWPPRRDWRYYRRRDWSGPHVRKITTAAEVARINAILSISKEDGTAQALTDGLL